MGRVANLQDYNQTGFYTPLSLYQHSVEVFISYVAWSALGDPTIHPWSDILLSCMYPTPFRIPSNSMNLDVPFWCISGKSKLFLRMNESATYQLRQLRSEKALGKARLKAGQVRRWNVGERGIFSQICPAQFSTAGAWRWKWFDSNLLPFSQVYTLQETMPFPARKSYLTQKCRLIGVGDGQLVPYRSTTNLCS